MPGVARIAGGQLIRNAVAGGNVFAPIGVVTKPVGRAILPTATPTRQSHDQLKIGL
jgi:hypothetical protein